MAVPPVLINAPLVIDYEMEGNSIPLALFAPVAALIFVISERLLVKKSDKLRNHSSNCVAFIRIQVRGVKACGAVWHFLMDV